MITIPQEHKAREVSEHKVPHTSDDFEAYWKRPPEYAEVLKEIGEDESQLSDVKVSELRDHNRAMQSKHTRRESPYMISVPMIIKLCSTRAYQRLVNDKVSTISTIMSQMILALVIGSIFYGTPNTTGYSFSKGSTLFFAILINALLSISEINNLYEQRLIVEKHVSYAFYHPWTEAMAGVVTKIHVKFATAVVFNITLDFLASLRAQPSQFFIFFLLKFVSKSHHEFHLPLPRRSHQDYLPSNGIR